MSFASTELAAKWEKQFRRGFLELCVLAAIQHAKQTYGFELMETLNQVGLLVGEGTLYPLLTRMSQEGLLQSRWEAPAGAGHPRKFYELSPLGHEAFTALAYQFEGNVNCYLKLSGRQLNSTPETTPVQSNTSSEETAP